jgi:hypothetical protein
MSTPGEIIASTLTDNAADDAGQVRALLGQIEGEIASVTADGAYDGEPVYQAVARRQSDRVPDIVIPPRASAVPSRQSAEAQSQRDHYIRIIAEKGRMARQKATGYGRCNLAEASQRRCAGPQRIAVVAQFVEQIALYGLTCRGDIDAENPRGVLAEDPVLHLRRQLR